MKTDLFPPDPWPWANMTELAIQAEMFETPEWAWQQRIP